MQKFMHIFACLHGYQVVNALQLSRGKGTISDFWSRIVTARDSHPLLVIFLASLALHLAWPESGFASQDQTFVWVADTRGNSDTDQVNTAVLDRIVDSIKALNPKPVVVVFGGDGAYRGGSDDGIVGLDIFKAHFNTPLENAGIPTAYAVGNHELYTKNASANPYPLTRQTEFQNDYGFNTSAALTTNYSAPANSPGSSYTRLAFSFTIGNSLFVVVDSFHATDANTNNNTQYPPYGVDATQRAWVTSVLDNSTAANKFVLSHIPAWSPSSPSESNDMKAFWDVIAGKASVYFCGHEHLYYRTAHDGTYEVLAGSGGAILGQEPEEEAKDLGPQYPGDVYALSYNYSVVNVSGRYVTITSMDQHNNILDQFQFFNNTGANNSVITNSTPISSTDPSGILAASGNTITNNATISGVATGIDVVSNNVIVNSAAITPASGGNGIHAYNNNTITNTASGSISGNSAGFWGIWVNNGNTVTNQGTIDAQGTNSIAFLGAGDGNSLTNSGTISASGTGSYAVQFLGSSNTLTNSGTISGNIWFGSGTNYLTNTGTISGSGALYKTGSGSLTIRGTNAYTGGTFLSGGIININADANLGAAAGTLSFNGGTLQTAASLSSARNITLNAAGGSFDTNGFSLSLTGTIVGTGSLTKLGLGTLNLSGTNTYTGGTVINAGTLSVASWSNLGGESNPLTFGGGTLLVGGLNPLISGYSIPSGGVTFDGSSGQTVSGVLSGSGPVNIIGPGTVTLSGSNTYTGGTHLNGGTLSIFSDTNLGAPSGILSFNGGSLLAASPLSIARSITIGSGGGLIDTGSFTSTLSGPLSGNGPLFIGGSGRLNLTGNGLGFTGQTSVNSGMLFVAASGSLGGEVVVQSGATLGGYGTVTNVSNNGMVSPGGSIGTLNVSGNYSQSAGSVFLNEISPFGQGDRLNIAGAASLNGGTFFVSAPIAFYRTGSMWTTLTATGGVSGTFSNVVQDFPSNILRFQPLYTPNGVYTVATRQPYADYAPNSRAASAGVGLNKGAYSAYGDFGNALLSLDLATPQALSQSLNQLHPEPYDAFTQSGFDTGALLTASVQNRLQNVRTGPGQNAFGSPFDVAALQPVAFNDTLLGSAASVTTPVAGAAGSEGLGQAGPQYGAFLQPFGMTARQGGTGGRTPYGFNAWGGMGGVDFRLPSERVAGLSAGYMGRALNLRTPAKGNGQVESLSLGGYGSQYGENWFVDGHVRAGYDSYQAKRALSVPGNALTAKSTWTGWNMAANLGGGYDWLWQGFIMGPTGSLDFALISQNGFTETGAGSLGLRVSPHLDGSLRSGLGARLARPMQFAWGNLTPELRVQWGHEFLSCSRDIKANFEGFDSASFTTKTVAPASDWAAVSAGVSMRFSEQFSVNARYATDVFRQGWQSQAGSLSLRFQF